MALMKTQLQTPRSPERFADTCPHCSTHVVNVQGIADCPDCNWTAK